MLEVKQRMKKILIVANNSGGLYDFRHDLIITLGKTADVYVITPDGDKVDLLQKICKKVILIPIDRRGTNPFKDIKLMLTYRNVLKRLKPDLVITYTIKPNIYGGLVSRFMKIPYAVNITGLGTAIENGGLLQKFVCMMYRFVLEKAKVVFFENSSNRDRMVELGTVKKEKTKVINGAGVNLEEFKEQPYPEDDVIRFLFVGRLMREKGVDELISAAKRLHKEYKNKVEVHFVGSYEEGYKHAIEECERAGIAYYHGEQLDVRPFYEKCSAVVLPSYHEGMSNVLLEGAACGRPLITSDIPGCREAVVEDITGYLCKVRDFDSLYQRMKAFHDLSFEQRKTMGLQSRMHIEKHFDKKMVVKETIINLF